MSTLITQFTAPAVRHLTWCLLSPPLAYLKSVPAVDIIEDDSLRNWLEKLNNNPSPLLDYIQQNNHKLLGSYFECLWQYYFLNGPSVSLYNQHVQVNSHKQTLGELDVLAEINYEPYHIELAVKFYLHQPNTTGLEPAHWLGPQSRDRLDIKLDKLIQKQFPFLHQQETAEHLKELGIAKPYKQALALKGYLFSQYNTKYQLPNACKTGLCMGNWLHASHIQSMIQNAESKDPKWVLLSKHEWLGDYYTDNQAGNVIDSCTLEILIHQHFYQNENPNKLYALMVISVQAEKEKYTEKERFFIVHDNWPEA